MLFDVLVRTLVHGTKNAAKSNIPLNRFYHFNCAHPHLVAVSTCVWVVCEDESDEGEVIGWVIEDIRLLSR